MNFARRFHLAGLTIVFCSVALSSSIAQSAKLAAATRKTVKPEVKATAAVKLPTTVIDPELSTAIKSAPAASDWPNSNAARILDLVNVEVKPDGTVVSDYRTTLKLFNERARSLAEVSLPYNASYQNLLVTKARTIKKDGTVVDVNAADIRTSSPYSDYAMYDDSMVVGFSMPGVEDDCIIDYSWREVTRPLLMPGNFWDFWAFTGNEPVSVSRYVLKTPAGKQVKYKVYNDDAVKPEISNSSDGKWTTYTWQTIKTKPVEPEPAMPPMREAHVWMQVSTLNSWQDISSWFWKLAKPQGVANPALKKTVEELIAGKNTDDEKARAIYDWVANRVRYVGLEFGLSAFKPHASPEVYNKLYGDCKDKALLLVTMLGQAGIKAHPVLLHTETHHSMDKELPSLNAFDHCITLADVAGKKVWLDGTAETCAYGDIPDGDRGAHALVIRDGAGSFEWIPTYKATENGTVSLTNVSLRPDGSATVKVEVKMLGASAQQLRSYVRSITPEQRKQAAQTMAQSYTVGGAILDYKLPDGMEKDGPYVINLNLTAPNRTKRTKNLLILPLGSTVSTGGRSNPFVKDSRIWPIVVEEAGVQKSETVITIPEGYTVEDTPQDMTLSTAMYEYQRTISVSPDEKTVTVKVISTNKPGRVPPTEYEKVKQYYDKVINASEDVIVLRKAPNQPMVAVPAEEISEPMGNPNRGRVIIDSDPEPKPRRNKGG